MPAGGGSCGCGCGCGGTGGGAAEDPPVGHPRSPAAAPSRAWAWASLGPAWAARARQATGECAAAATAAPASPFSGRQTETPAAWTSCGSAGARAADGWVALAVWAVPEVPALSAVRGADLLPTVDTESVVRLAM